MNAFILQMVNQKVNNFTKDELLSLSRQHQMPINETQAAKVISILRSEKIDVGNVAQCERLVERLQTEVDSHVSGLIKQLLDQYAPMLRNIGYNA